MWLRIIFSRFFFHILRFLIAPLFALTLGFIVLFVLSLLVYIWLVSESLKLFEKNPLLGGVLIFLEGLVFVLVLFSLRRLYQTLRERYKNRR